MVVLHHAPEYTAAHSEASLKSGSAARARHLVSNYTLAQEAQDPGSTALAGGSCEYHRPHMITDHT